LRCIAAKTVIFGWRAVLPVTTRPAERRRRTDTVGRSSGVARDRGHGLHVIDASIMPTVVRAKVTVPAL
jgi:hypothetical protein